MSQHSKCVQFNLDRINEQFPKALWLTTEQVASLMGLTANNVAQKLGRGHFDFNIVYQGSRPYFPVFNLAEMLCGENSSPENLPIAVPTPKKIRGKIRSHADFLDRMANLMKFIDISAEKIKKAENQENFNKLRAIHEYAIEEVILKEERLILLKMVG